MIPKRGESTGEDLVERRGMSVIILISADEETGQVTDTFVVVWSLNRSICSSVLN